jgi:hypothetical protein
MLFPGFISILSGGPYVSIPKYRGIYNLSGDSRYIGNGAGCIGDLGINGFTVNSVLIKYCSSTDKHSLKIEYPFSPKYVE